MVNMAELGRCVSGCGVPVETTMGEKSNRGSNPFRRLLRRVLSPLIIILCGINCGPVCDTRLTNAAIIFPCKIAKMGMTLWAGV